MKKIKKFALDVDEVCLGFCEGFTEECLNHNINIKVGKVWNFFDHHKGSYDIFKNLSDDFWLNLKRIDQSKNLNVVPSAYISHRGFSTKITEKCLEVNGFPKAPVFHVNFIEEKLKVVKELGIDVFVDDRASTILYCLENGIEAYLLDQIWNEDYTNLPRIYSLGELDKICQ